jgi:Extensin-like protein C-terminus
VPDFRVSPKLLGGLFTAVSVLFVPSAASAFSPYLVVPEPAVAEASPAYRYANMTDAEALAELDRRSVLYSRVERAPGVRAPIRLTGRLHGVYVHSSLPADRRVTSPFEILDARLALALDDFCALLERHDIDEAVHYTMYRPNVAPSHGPPDEAPAAVSGPTSGHDGGSAVKPQGARPRPDVRAAPGSKQGAALDDGKLPKSGASRGGLRPQTPALKAATPTKASSPSRVVPARVPTVTRVARRDPAAMGLHATTWAPPGTRHPAGLAIDVALLHKRDGRWLSVQHDFHGRIGAKTCGEGARVPESPDARELHALVCESSDLSLFTYVLTPDFNAAHADHFHMEVKPGVRWFLYH